MNLYHGSNKKFDSFKISKELARTPLDYLVEGLGIYMVDEKNIQLAKENGHILYTIEVDENEILDATNEDELRDLINEFDDTIGGIIRNYITDEQMNYTIEGILCGDMSITRLHEEFFNLMESQEVFYMAYEKKIDRLNDEMEEEWHSLLPNIIKYYDRNYKHNIYICFKNEDTLKILTTNEF